MILRADDNGTDTFAPSIFHPTDSNGGLRSALSVANAFNGTAITAISESFSVTNTLILGFDKCWSNTDATKTYIGRRSILDHVNCDGRTGFAVYGGGGGTQFDDLNVRSFLTGTGFVNCTNCNEYDWDGGTGRGDLIAINPTGTNGPYQVVLDVTGTGVFPPVTGDTIWVRTPTTNAQSAGGRYTVGTVSPVSCAHTCVSFDLAGTVSSSAALPLMGTATFDAGSTRLTAIAGLTGGATASALAVGMHVGSASGGCIPSGTIVAINPDWNTVWISSNAATTCASTTNASVRFWDEPYATAGSSVTLSSQVRTGDAFSILGAAGVTFNNCHQSNHYTGFRAGSGSGQTRFVNCVNENDHDLEDDDLYGLICEGDCGGVDWVNGILAQHATGAIVVNTSSGKAVHVSNAGIGPSNGRRSGRYADVENGILQLDNSTSDQTGNLFVRHDGTHAGYLTISGDFMSKGTLYQQDATAIVNTTGCGNTFAAPTPYSCAPAAAALRPGGRLTLTPYSVAPPTGAVMTSDVSSSNKIYYVPYASEVLPIWNGSAYGVVDIGSTGLSMNLNTGVQFAANLYDIFAETGRAGVPELCTGPAWANVTTRSAAIAKNQGIWGNSGSMTCTHAAAAFSCPAYSCTYLGTLYALSDGHATMQLGPAIHGGGPALCLCLYNAYNRVPVVAEGLDNDPAYSDSYTVWKPMNVSQTGGFADGVHYYNSITVIDGLGEMNIDAQLVQRAIGGTGAAQIGISVSSDAGAIPNPVLSSQNPGSTAVSLSSSLRAPPLLGLWFVQAMEHGGSGTAPQYGGTVIIPNSQMLSLQVDD
ncbi:MAG TPA: hypothetical protein VG889_03465 [Rhizomicrobium sp.]|nr:hypothetical protein [Rhizomicrobium sp.]